MEIRSKIPKLRITLVILIVYIIDQFITQYESHGITLITARSSSGGLTTLSSLWSIPFGSGNWYSNKAGTVVDELRRDCL
jgi:hypothetical protein